MGRLTTTVDTSRYNNEIAYYKLRTSEHMSRAVAWMMVAKACGMHKDASRIIGRMVYAARFVWE
jgi:hypothetical protein